LYFVGFVFHFSKLSKGGEGIDKQFSNLANNPDIIIATPGRLLHIMKESGMQLSAVELCICDEADRLFEMGLASQLTEIIHKLPSSRQTGFDFKFNFKFYFLQPCLLC
jgi:ATP-dependent RNA helicase DDX54/DBP10